MALHYEYSPFGETIVATGPNASDFLHRFSTKYFCDEFGMGDWGRRWYSPSMARWLSRDPIGERGGLNNYLFVHNLALSQIDVLGLFSYGTEKERYNGYGDKIRNYKWGLTEATYTPSFSTELGVGRCCKLKEVNYRLDIIIWLPTKGQRYSCYTAFGLMGTGFNMSEANVSNVKQHEYLHVTGHKRVGSVLFSKLESKCSGKRVLLSAGEGASDEACRAKWDGILQKEQAVIIDALERAGARVDSEYSSIWHGPPDRSLSSDEIANYYQFLTELVADNMNHPFCKSYY